MAAWNNGVENPVKDEKIKPEETHVRKKKGRDNDVDQMPQESVEDNDENIHMTQEDLPRKRKKNKKRHQQEEEEENILHSNEAQMINIKSSFKVKNKKKRNREAEDINEESVGNNDGKEITSSGICTTKMRKKKKDKKSVNENCGTISEEHSVLKRDVENLQVKKEDNCDNTVEEIATDRIKKSKKKKERNLSMSAISDECVEEYQRKKKKKKSKDKY